MSIQLQWDPVLENVVYWTIHGQWTWHDFNDTFQQEMTLVAPLNGQRWDVIGDFLGAPTLPPGPGGVRQVVRAVQHAQTMNFGVLAVITRSTFMRTMVQVATRANPSVSSAFQLCETPDQAREIIRAERLKTLTH